MASAPHPSDAIAILGVPFDSVTKQQTIERIRSMIRSGLPHYIATANVDFLVQARQDVELRRVLFEADLVVCDGTPLLWAARWLGSPLPERVAGSDLVPLLLREAAERAYRLYFLGGAPETAARAVANIQAEHPRLKVTGFFSPPVSSLLDMDHDDINRRIANARPDLLLVSLGVPKQEKWIAMNYRRLGVPVSIGVGAAIDFLAGRVGRAPLWMQRMGMEWLARLAQEPRRLLPRYTRDLLYFPSLILSQALNMPRRRLRAISESGGPVPLTHLSPTLRIPECLDHRAVRAYGPTCESLLAESPHLLLLVDDVTFIDTSGVGFLIRLNNRARRCGGALALVAPSRAVRRALGFMRILEFFLVAPTVSEATGLLSRHRGASGALERNAGQPRRLAWTGEVTAANMDIVWDMTRRFILDELRGKASGTIDLHRLTVLDTSGVGVMIRARALAAECAIGLTFVGGQPNVRSVLRLARREGLLSPGAAV